MTSHPVARTKASRRPHQRRDKRLWGLLLISPWLVGLVIFKLAPILTTLGISFTNIYFIEPFPFKFVGLKNYIDLFKDPNLWTAFLGTFKLAGIIIPIQTGAAILLASLLSNEKLHIKNTLRVLFFLPSIIPSAAALFMWQGFTNPKSGWLNPLILDPLGLAKYVHFTSRGATPSLLILSTFWAIGPGFLIIMGAMQGIPTDVFEAALVDGANRLRRFFSITLPMISPAIFFTLILNLTAIFGGAVLLDRGNTFDSNLSSVDTFLYYILFRTFRMGSAASLAWIFFIFMLVLVVILFATSKRWVYFPDPEN
jgi:multiple sugar transport system permease protein